MKSLLNILENIFDDQSIEQHVDWVTVCRKLAAKIIGVCGKLKPFVRTQLSGNTWSAGDTRAKQLYDEVIDSFSKICRPITSKAKDNKLFKSGNLASVVGIKTFNHITFYIYTHADRSKFSVLTIDFKDEDVSSWLDGDWKHSTYTGIHFLRADDAQIGFGKFLQTSWKDWGDVIFEPMVMDAEYFDILLELLDGKQ